MGAGESASVGELSYSARDAAAMRRALELASRGPARGINPRVGCVIYGEDGRMLAEGWHRGAGTAHAEVDALSQLEPGAARGATAVVTLEPCNHTGLTGPCSEALLAAGIARVIYGAADPGIHSRGGAERLRSAGVDVLGGVLEGEVEALIGDWLFAARHGRPFITLKWASSLDGRTAAADGTSQWITGPEGRRRVHSDRAASEAVVVGTGTVLTDDPALTARDDSGLLLDEQPIPVVIGERPVPATARVRQHPKTVVELATHDLVAAFAELHRRGIRTAYVEAGPTLAGALIGAGLVDELHAYIAPTLLGGPHLAVDDLGVATIGDQRRLELTAVERLGRDVLIIARPLAPHSQPPEQRA